MFLAHAGADRGAGTLEDYQRAQRFLGGNLRSMVSVADIRPTWIEKSDRSWSRSVGSKGSEFIVVDATKNTSAPAFDHARRADALSRASRQTYGYENVSPHGRWAAYLKDHNLFLRDTSIGESVQSTRDGVPGWDYATPLPRPAARMVAV